MAYKYTVYAPDKRIVQGTVDATSESMAEATLYQAGYQRILSLKEVPPKLSLEKLIPTIFGIKARDMIDFSVQLATLIESGITLLTALRLLAGQAPKAALSKVITGLVIELQEGSSLSQALNKYPHTFPHTYCQMIQANEQAGNIESGLRQASDYMEKQAAMKQRVTRALAYPAFVLLMAIGVSALLITVALPPLVGLFTSLGVELPWTTRLLMAGAGFFTAYSLYLLGGLFAVIILTAGYVRLPAGRLSMDRLMLKVPVIGPINIERNMYHFCQTASMLLKAGLRLPQIMDIVAQTVGNSIIRQALREVREKLIQGQGLSQPMADIELFPRLSVDMVVVGEKTGTIDSTLATLANFYEQRVARRIDTLTSMIEPSLTVAIGLVVLFIALSMITPLYSILRSMH